MTQVLKRFGWLAALALLITVLVLRAAPWEEPDPVEDVAPTTQFVGPVFTRYQKEGVREWTLRAERVEADLEDASSFVMYGIADSVIYKDGKPNMTFRADQGRWDEGRGSLELSGNVQVFRDGQSIAADRLAADPEAEMFIFEGNVRVESEGGLTLLAERVVYDQARQSVEYGPTLGPIRLP